MRLEVGDPFAQPLDVLQQEPDLFLNRVRLFAHLAFFISVWIVLIASIRTCGDMITTCARRACCTTSPNEV